MRNEDIIAKLREANLPPYVETTTLALLGQQGLRRVISDKSFRVEGRLQSYMLFGSNPTSPATRIGAVFAKELVLSGVRLYFAGTAAFSREIRLCRYDAEVDPLSPVLDYVRKGMIVLTEFDNPETHGDTAALRQEVFDLLCSHVYGGGGLILVATEGFPTSIKHREFTEIASTFTRITV